MPHFGPPPAGGGPFRFLQGAGEVQGEEKQVQGAGRSPGRPQGGRRRLRLRVSAEPKRAAPHGAGLRGRAEGGGRAGACRGQAGRRPGGGAAETGAARLPAGTAGGLRPGLSPCKSPPFPPFSHFFPTIPPANVL